MIREKFKINESNAKIDYIELLEKLACYEKEQLLNYNEALLMQKEVLLLKNKFYPKNSIKIADTLINIGLVCFNLGQFNSAIKYYQEALENKLKSLPNNDLSIAETFNKLGNVLLFKRYKQFNESFKTGYGNLSEFI
jgi:tetratricopeptide (TPR) repeat protein